MQGIDIVGVAELSDVCEWAKGRWKQDFHPLETVRTDLRFRRNLDYSDIHGQESVKRATLVAVAGNHNLLYIGPPGAGKTMMAKRIPGILPEMSLEESLEITKIYSAAGLLEREEPLIVSRPFREIHHSITRAALIGGGTIPHPGEVTLAHGGVLFIDELAEMNRGVLECLRQPLEEHCVRITRNHGAFCFPADFMLVMAMNPCRCGYYPDMTYCKCSQADVDRYFGKIRGPVLDRIDICTATTRLGIDDFSGESGTGSAQMRERILKAQEIQAARFAGTDIRFNSQMNRTCIEQFCRMKKADESILDRAYRKYNMSARGYYKVLKVARTIADLNGSEEIRKTHLIEAISYRNTYEK